MVNTSGDQPVYALGSFHTNYQWLGEYRLPFVVDQADSVRLFSPFKSDYQSNFYEVLKNLLNNYLLFFLTYILYQTFRKKSIV